jgi:hypothetical protein
MTRMAGSVRTTRMALTIGLRLPLGMLGCSRTGRSLPDVLVMSPESAATLALRADWDTISRSPHPGFPSAGARRYQSPRQGTGKVSRACRLRPGSPLASVLTQAGCFDGMSDGQSGGCSGAGDKGTHKWGRARTAKRKGGAGKSNSSEFVLASCPTPRGGRPAGVIVRGGVAIPCGGRWAARKQALACKHADPDAHRCREVKAEVDASTHPHHPNGRACPAQKDDSCYPVFRPNQYL